LPIPLWRFPAEQPGGRSITLGDLTFSNHGTKEVKGQGELDLEADKLLLRTHLSPGHARTKAQGGNRERVEYGAQLQHPGSTSGCEYPGERKVLVAIAFPSSGVVRFFASFTRRKA